MSGWNRALEDLPTSNLNKSKDEVWEAAAEGRSLDEATVSPEEGLEYYAELVAERILTDKDALVLVTGPTGEGKSTLAMRLATRVSELLRDGWDDRSRELIAANGFTKTPWNVRDGLAYTVSDIVSFYRSATEANERGRIAIFDEGVQGLFSGDVNNPDVKLLVKAFNLVRLSGCVLFVCVPDLMSIAKSMRVRLAHIWLAVRMRGLARCHLRDRRLAYKPETNFGFSVSRRAPFLTWTPFEPSSEVWLDYLERKRRNLLAVLADTEQKVGANANVSTEVARVVTERSHAAERARRYRKRKRDARRLMPAPPNARAGESAA